MTRYVEPTLRTRQLFFLAVISLGGLLLASSRLDDILPPFSSEPLAALDQMLGRSLVAATLSTIYYALFSVVAIHYTRRAVESRQWPPNGMTVPFRLKVKEIKNPRNAWMFLAIILFMFTAQATIPWFGYAKQRSQLEELKEMFKVPTNKTFQPTAKKGAASSEYFSMQNAWHYNKNSDYSKAAEIYETLANAGDDYAKYWIALFYYYGFHYERDIYKAKEIFKELCANYVEPCTRLAIIYNELEMYDQAEAAYLKAAEGKDLEAYGNLFYLYSNKKWHKYSESEALKWQQALDSADWKKSAPGKTNNLTRNSTMEPADTGAPQNGAP